jgi:hypothetical protein
MMRRLMWFAGGVAAGAAGAGYAKRKVTTTVRRTAGHLAPANVARGAAGTVRRSGQRVAAAVREGRSASQQRQSELRAELEGRRVRLDERLQPGDQVLIDGQPAESGRVIVMRRPE